ncbi:MAG: glycoside hydrolase family 5 protein [Paludibacteraceae bacterium]|nr:glycoside hydrolase family 5 protein [Paludibacteraceae bacterium]
MRNVFIGALMAAAVGLCSCGGCASKPESVSTVKVDGGAGYPENSPVADHGRLQVIGKQLCDEAGNPVQLAGMSTMGWQWCGDCYTRESIENLVKEWNISILRLAMYVEEEGYNTDPEGFTKKMCEFIDICGDLGIYCLVDWHVLCPGNPLDPKYAGADEFFHHIANKYANKSHVLYEICNEPNNCQEKGDTTKPWVCTKEANVTWDMIAEYANRIIPVIQSEYDAVAAPHPIIIVGTPQWDQLVDACLKEGMCQGNGKDICEEYPVRDARLKQDNIMYTFHFYANEHNSGFEKDGKPDFYNMYSYMYDVFAKLPIFCTEFGPTDADGNGVVAYDKTDTWLLMFEGRNAGTQLVSYCCWSYSDNYRTSSVLKPGACERQAWNDLTPAGEYIKKVLAVVNGGAKDTTVLKISNIYKK